MKNSFLFPNRHYSAEQQNGQFIEPNDELRLLIVLAVPFATLLSKVCYSFLLAIRPCVILLLVYGLLLFLTCH